MKQPNPRLIQLLQDPRVAKLVQDPRVQQAVFRALKLRGRAQERTDRLLDSAAKRLNLATAREVRELKRTIRRLEERLAETEADD
ncbi:MAG: hypothetical protein AAGF92_13680 [Myxococcota bacterium]